MSTHSQKTTPTRRSQPGCYKETSEVENEKTPTALTPSWTEQAAALSGDAMLKVAGGTTTTNDDAMSSSLEARTGECPAASTTSSSSTRLSFALGAAATAAATTATTTDDDAAVTVQPKAPAAAAAAGCPDLTNKSPPPRAPSSSVREKNVATAATADYGGDDGDITANGKESSANAMVGRRVLKPLGATVCSGWVQDHKPADAGKEESWVIHWDNDSENDEEVTRPTLDKRLNLQSVKEREFPKEKKAPKRGHPRRDLSSSKKSPRSGQNKKSSPGGVSAAASPKPGTKKRSASSPATGTPKKKGKADGAVAGPSKGKVQKEKADQVLEGGKADLGKLVVKEFSEGFFTGEVVKIKSGPSTLWVISYEDGDSEDLNEDEMLAYTSLYQVLLTMFEAAVGQAVTSKDEVDELEENRKEDPSQLGSPKKKGKGKGKPGAEEGGSAGDEKGGKHLVGVSVRKHFDEVEDAFDGRVSKFFPDESDDDFGELWLIKYSDGDSEHMDLSEVTEARALYDKHYALQKKEIELTTSAKCDGNKLASLSEKKTKMAVYAEKPAGSRLFLKIKNYREYKKSNS